MAHASRLGQKKERKKERLNDGNNNGQATYGARKPHGPILQRNKCLIINCHFGWQRNELYSKPVSCTTAPATIGDEKVVVTQVTIYTVKLAAQGAQEDGREKEAQDRVRDDGVLWDDGRVR